MLSDDLPGISQRQIEGIIKGVRRHSAPGLYLPGNNGVLFDVYQWSDYDTYMFTDVFELRCFPKDERPSDINNRIWGVKISYSRTDGEDYDYVATARKSNTTAFKHRPPGKEVKVRFKVDEGYRVEFCSMVGVDRDTRLAAELLVLERQIIQLDETTQDIGRWAKSGLDMLALCNGNLCGRHALIPNRTISTSAARGLNLNEFKGHLACKKCGARNPRVRPPLSA